MPRPLRIEFEGAWYHVMNRGANHQNIFYNDNHRLLFLSILEEISKDFYVEIHAYCLMDNHYHILLRTGLANLGRVMRHLDGVFTQKFNRIEERDGPLFRGRYKAILIEANSYLLKVSRYIHLNPLVAGLNHCIYNSIWSSYIYYLKSELKPAWLETQFTLKSLDKLYPGKDYQAFIKEGLDDEIASHYASHCLATILGSPKFIATQLEKIKNQAPFMPDIKRTKRVPDIETILNTVCQYYKIEKEQLIYHSYIKLNIPRSISIYLAKRLAQSTHRKIAEYFNLETSGVGVTLRRIKESLENNLELTSDLEKISNIIMKTGVKY